MEVLCIGDLFLSSERFKEAIEEALGENSGPVREVSWGGEGAGSAEDQHHLQQVMEQDGPEAVPPPEGVVEAVGDAEVIVVHFAPIPEAVLEAEPNLKAVVVARAGFENVNVEAASERGILVANLEGRNASAVAEQAIALMLAETRDVARTDRGIRTGRWPKEFPQYPHELGGGRTVGVIGFGQVGRQLARKLSGFDVRLLVYDPYVNQETIEAHGGEKTEDFERIFREGDFVSLHARLSEETRGFIGREHFEMMKPAAYFINNARSRMVRYDDLYEVLKEGRIAGAALDVHDDEPLPEGSPWLELENVTFTPHTAGATDDAWENSYRMAAGTVREFVETGSCKTAVNAEDLEGMS